MSATTYEIASLIVMALILIPIVVLVLNKLRKLDLQELICELADPAAPGAPPKAGKPSLSRFQLLLFTFLVAGLFVVLSLQSGNFVEIPNGVLGLMGISSGSFVISKGLSK